MSRKSGRRGFRRRSACARFLRSAFMHRRVSKIARDHDLLDLAGAFVDAEDAHVAIEALDAVIGDIAGAAENLHRACRRRGPTISEAKYLAQAASIVTLSPRRASSRHPAPCSARHRLRSCSPRACPGSAGNRRSSGRTARARARSSRIREISRSATPTQTPEMCSRPRSSTCIATLKPSPSSPRRKRAGTRAFSKITSQICAPCWPIFFSGLPMVMPGVFAGTMKAEIPPAPFLRRIAARHQREHAGAVGVGDEALGAVDDVVVAVADRR